MNRLLVVLSVVVIASSCSKKDEKAEPERPAAPNEPEAPQVPEAVIVGEATPRQGLAAATEGAKNLAAKLKGRLMSAMQDGGPESALEACASEAQALTRSVGTSRLRVGRSTLRLRNQKNSESPEWVDQWLTATGERKAEGVQGVSEVVDGTARVLMPLAVGGLCLACHGDPASQSDGMKALLAKKYPDDKAVGYGPGDLRGALWAEFDLSPPK